MLIERLKEKFNYDEPIFINEIYNIMNDYSKSKVFELINEALKRNVLKRYDQGIYYCIYISFQLHHLMTESNHQQLSV